MRIKILVALALVCFFVLIAINGCFGPLSVDLYSDPGHPLVGWKCPPPDQMSHVVVHTTPPCAWIPGGISFRSCSDADFAAAAEARGCVPEPSPTATSTPTPKSVTFAAFAIAI